MIKLNELVDFLENVAPSVLQESYDNSGLIYGSPGQEIGSALLTIDITEEVMDEAIALKSDIIISHHPLIFNGIKKITGKNDMERCLVKAIKNDIAIYAGHTNFDSVANGVNAMICKKIGLQNCSILQPSSGLLKKLVTFIPSAHSEKVRKALFDTGAGHIGNYDSCGFQAEGTGSFRGNEYTNPWVGEKGTFHEEKEFRFETIFPSYLENRIIKTLKEVHPYEEVAYDIYPLENKFEKAGMGMTGMLPEPMEEIAFLAHLKQIFKPGSIRHTRLTNRLVTKVAVCGGAGSFLLNQAISAGAGFFVSADFKYHQFFNAENKIVIADVGHFESEQFTKELFYELLTKKFPTFAVRLSEVNTNPVFYF